MQTDIFTKPTKAKFVEQTLRQAGWNGVSNWDLNRITFRYSAVIHNLRKQGHIIDTLKINPKTGLVKYRWVS